MNSSDHRASIGELLYNDTTVCMTDLPHRRVWYPEGLILKRGKVTKAVKNHQLGAKTIADVAEALIGAALLTNYETKSMDMAVRAVTELVCSTDHTMITFADYYARYSKPRYQTEPASAPARALASSIEEKYDYRFSHPRLLRSAFTHPSYPYSYEHVPNYQRLEFLGDSLLDMACINFLFHRFPNRDPQWLTEHKMAMVSNHFLGAVCVALGFHRHLLQFSTVIQKQIGEYVEEINEAKREAIKDAIRTGQGEDSYARDYWVHTKHPPKCLPDMVEAYVGAIFVDSEFQYSEVERFFEAHIRWYFEDMSIYDSFASKEPTTLLSTVLLTQMGCLQWRHFTRETPSIGSGLPAQFTCALMIHKKVVAYAQAKSVVDAMVAVSEKSLALIAGLSPHEFREKYQCDCKAEDQIDVALEQDDVMDGNARASAVHG
jgi:endoribonuclease Dicer